jgi:hypothetical protein
MMETNVFYSFQSHLLSNVSLLGCSMVRLEVFASISILSSVMKQSRPDHTGVVSRHGCRPRISNTEYRIDRRALDRG